MRITSGVARSIRLVVPDSGAIRPTEDKVKESVFNTLGDLSGASVLDLFSGTGALGLEALSRGAARVVMVEREERHVAAMRTNLAAVLKAVKGARNAPEAGQVRIIQAEVHRAFSMIDGVFDIVLADPPYHPAPGEYGARSLLEDEALLPLVDSAAVLALEHGSDVRDLPWAPHGQWQCLKSRTFGIRTVSYARKGV